jgi:cell shape-determining protein MreD
MKLLTWTLVYLAVAALTLGIAWSIHERHERTSEVAVAACVMGLFWPFSIVVILGVKIGNRLRSKK